MGKEGGGREGGGEGEGREEGGGRREGGRRREEGEGGGGRREEGGEDLGFQCYALSFQEIHRPLAARHSPTAKTVSFYILRSKREGEG